MKTEKPNCQTPEQRIDGDHPAALQDYAGTLIVRGLMLDERLELAARFAIEQWGMVPEMLFRCVRDENGEPFFTADEWRRYGGGPGFGGAMRLFRIAKELSGMGDPEDNEKK